MSLDQEVVGLNPAGLFIHPVECLKLNRTLTDVHCATLLNFTGIQPKTKEAKYAQCA